jgi:predicted ATPase/class 3 adenylate cyclase
MADNGGLPSGVVTFLLTDIEGSTRLWQQHPAGMAEATDRHVEHIEAAVARNGGATLKAKGEGDSTFSVFASARAALAASVELQLAMDLEPWPEGVALVTRTVLHTGEAVPHDGDYFGSVVNRCARLRSIAHGGQILCSAATVALIGADDLPSEVTLRDLGIHSLRDLTQPERVHQVVHPDLRREFPPLRSLGSARSNLPQQRTSFVGREAELRRLGEHLAHDRMVTLTGVGGCGKTRLAVEAATLQLDRFDGVYFCDLSTVADADGAVVSVAQAAGVPVAGPMAPTVRPVRDDLLDHLSKRKALLILDNCEHLLDACATLADEILDRCPGVSLLATSREALDVEGERALTVASLGVPAVGEREGEAVTLFRARAALVQPDIDLDGEAGDHVAEICRRLDGIPLAIELAAAQCSALSPAQLAARLADRFRLLSGGRSRVPRQQTLAAMLDWSYDLLAADEQRLLTWLSVFPQPFTLEQAEALAAGLSPSPVAATLRRLIATSLVTQTADRYRLLETVRLYATDKLLASGEAEAARDGHAASVLDWVSSFPDDMVFGSRAGAQFVDEMDHILAALRWFEQRDRPGDLARLVSRAVIAFSRDLPSVAVWLAKGATADDLDPEERLRWVVATQWAAVATGDLATLAAIDPDQLDMPTDDAGMLESACHAFRALFHAMAWYNLGPDVVPGSDRAARDHIERGIAAVREPWAQGFSAAWLGLAEVGLGDLDRAAERFRWGVAAPRVPDALTGACLTMAGIVDQLRGDLDSAIEAMDGSLAIFATDPWGIATDFDSFWLASRGPLLSLADRHDDALAVYRRIVEHVHTEGLPALIVSIVLGCLGVSVHLNGEPELAIQLMVQGNERPISPLDHLVFDRYMAEAVEGLAAHEVEALKERGRALTLAEGADLAFSVLA